MRGVRVPAEHRRLEQAAVLRAVDELHGDAAISDQTWKQLAETFDYQQLIEVCMLIGQYHMVAFTLNSLGVELEPTPGLARFPEGR